MEKIISYIKNYLSNASVMVHVWSIILLAAVVWANYYYGVNNFIQSHIAIIEFSYWYGLLGFVYVAPFLLSVLLKQNEFSLTLQTAFLIVIAPAIFSWKMASPMVPFAPSSTNVFWNGIIYYPAKAAVVTSMVFITTLVLGKDENKFGLSKSSSSLQPYWFMLLLMVPLILAAATRPGFLQVYPKALHVQASSLSFTQVLLFELAYGIDFFTIEVFFRGFLVVYASRWLGANAILPMAMFYCVIHFGKPLGECISSFFGGMLLGIVSYHSRSIWGGLLVHVGIAWMMEGAAFLLR